MKRILSITGGGIRGIIPCCVLVELERYTGKLTRECFDFVAGTSTGALLAAAVAAGIPAKQVLRIYTERAKEIFTPGPTLSAGLMLSRGYRYDSTNIARVLESEFREAAGWVLNDSPIRLLLTAMHVSGHPWYFVKDGPKNSQVTGTCGLIDCAVASACAPTYFSPWYVHPGAIPIGWCYDGGVGVTGNPVYQACVEAILYDDFTRGETQVLSLGTGFYPAHQVNPPRGFLSTLSWAIDTLTSAPMDEQTQLVDRHYPGMQKHFNWELPQPIVMADLNSIPALLEVGQAAAKGMDWREVLL
jgi:patatin-like phospholipase/acyl hydrolase